MLHLSHLSASQLDPHVLGVYVENLVGSCVLSQCDAVCVISGVHRLLIPRVMVGVQSLSAGTVSKKREEFL